MTDTQITQALATRSPLPSVYAVISEFRCGYQKALRCLDAARAQQPKKAYTLEDF